MMGEMETTHLQYFKKEISFVRIILHFYYIQDILARYIC